MTNDANARPELEQSIPERFRDQLGAFSARLAIASLDVDLTYAQLDQAANAVAQELLSHIDTRGERVLLLADQGIAAAIATLGILKAGAAYVPLDPCASEESLADVAKLIEPVLALVEHRYRDIAARILPHSTGCMSIEDACMGANARDPCVRVSPNAIAYVYFTSGTSGKPKGVYDSHRNVLHNIWRYTVNLAIGPNDRLTLLQSPHFSGAVSSFFCAVLNGASSHPYDVRRLGFSAVPDWLRSHQITIYHSVPYIFREVITAGDFPALRCVRLEGDRASRQDIELFRRFCRPGTILANGLGATECGLVRQWRIDHQCAIPEGPVPIGDEIEDMQTLLLDDSGAEVAPGAIGEIVVRSNYLALGYWRDPELTAARFGTTDSASTLRTYRTGDLGRFISPKLLVYLGRKDLGAKLRGQWFDSYVVEEALRQLPAISDAVVSVQTSQDGANRVVAYVVPHASPALAIPDLRTHLSTRLPAAMIPTAWVVLDRLPVDANNKIDRAALAPALENVPGVRSTTAPAPNAPFEDRLLELWKEILGVQSLSLHDDFFALGGDSLAMMRIANRMQGMLSQDLPLVLFFTHPTIAGLAAELRRRADSGVA